MGLFHHHHWDEVGRTYTPRDPAALSIEGATRDTIERALFGQTVIELRCRCGDLKHHIVTGKVET